MLLFVCFRNVNPVSFAFIATQNSKNKQGYKYICLPEIRRERSLLLFLMQPATFNGSGSKKAANECCWRASVNFSLEMLAWRTH